MRLAILATLCSVALALPKPDPNAKYNIVKHEDHPDHKIKYVHNGVSLDPTGLSHDSRNVSISDVCEGATPGYTGYFVSGTKHFYFAYFESRSKPTTDPLAIWFNGGPGCSSFTGLLHENGPCNVNLEGTGTTKNEHAWINAANMIYIDQPLGVGFSYDEYTLGPEHYYPGSTLVAAEDLVIFLKLWYQHFPATTTNGLHLSGESYAGHYLPKFASTILKHNEASKVEDNIPLKSVLMGNGLFDFVIQEPSVYNVSCTPVNGVAPVLKEPVCEAMKLDSAKCLSVLAVCAREVDTPVGKDLCDVTFEYCEAKLLGVYQSSSRDIYDISRICPEDASCYPLDDATVKYLNTPRVRQGFGAVDPAIQTYQACDDNMLNTFYANYDPFHPSAPYVKDLLNKGLPILIYAGIHDVVCNFVGIEAMLKALPWIGQAQYNAAAAKPRKWSGGLTWEHANLRVARVNGAGHFVPHDQPVAALELFTSWIQSRAMV